jgi:hypothetical protein
MASVRIVLFRPVIDHMRGWEGDIGRSVSRLATIMAIEQRFLVAKKTGKLAASIRTGPKGRGALGIQIQVGANPGRGPGRIGYAYWNDLGAMPHYITPKPSNRRGRMVFFWPKVGHVVHLRVVHHPGNRAYHWAERGASAGMDSWNRFRPGVGP